MIYLYQFGALELYIGETAQTRCPLTPLISHQKYVEVTVDDMVVPIWYTQAVGKIPP